MKITTKLSLLPLVLFLSPQALASNDYTFGVGLGSLYSGLGVNAGIQSDVDLKYISAGCVAVNSFGSACGMGVGWITTDMFDFQTPKHGISLYLGVVGSESFQNRYEPVYGGGLGYTYFFSSIGKSGFNIGFTLVAGSGDYDNIAGGMFQAGYQF